MANEETGKSEKLYQESLKQRLKHLTKEAMTSLSKDNKLYQLNLNNRLQIQIKKVQPGSFAFVQKKYFTCKEKKHRVAQVEDRSY